MRIGWQIYDPVTAETITLEINPNDDGSLQYEKQMTYKNTSAPGGNVVAFEGRDAPYTSSFSGVLLTENQYNTYVDIFSKRYPLQLTDDLGRSFLVYFTSFKPKRKISRTYPWRHEYTCDYYIMGGAI